MAKGVIKENPINWEEMRNEIARDLFVKLAASDKSDGADIDAVTATAWANELVKVLFEHHLRSDVSRMLSDLVAEIYGRTDFKH